MSNPDIAAITIFRMRNIDRNNPLRELLAEISKNQEHQQGLYRGQKRRD